MEFADACKVFESKFREAEPCCSIENGLLVGSTECGVEVHWRKDSNGAFEVYSKKVGNADGPSFLHCAKMQFLDEEDINDLAKSLASTCRSIVIGKSGADNA